MAKPTYYLWVSEYQTLEEFTWQKEKYIRFGFRVVTFFNAPSDCDITEGMKALVKNHMIEV